MSFLLFVFISYKPGSFRPSSDARADWRANIDIFLAISAMIDDY